MSDYLSIGFAINSPEDGKKLIDVVREQGMWLKTERGFYVSLVSKSGAELWAQADSSKKIIGSHPFFSGKSRLTFTYTPIFASDPSSMDASIFAMLKVGEGETDYPVFFDVPDLFLHSDLKENEEIIVQMTAFARPGLKIFNSYQEYQPAENQGVAPEAFVPVGTISLGDIKRPPSAIAVCAGTIVECKELENEFTGKKFYWLFVKSLSAHFDMVIAPELCTVVPKRGDFIYGKFWMTGKVVAPK